MFIKEKLKEVSLLIEEKSENFSVFYANTKTGKIDVVTFSDDFMKISLSPETFPYLLSWVDTFTTPENQESITVNYKRLGSLIFVSDKYNIIQSVGSVDFTKLSSVPEDELMVIIKDIVDYIGDLYE